MKISGFRLFATSDLFLLKKYQDSIILSPGTTMIGIIVGTSGRYTPCWSISWKNNNNSPEIDIKYLHNKVVKCDRSINDWFMKARRKFDVFISV